MNLIESLLGTLIPILISEAESLLGPKPSSNDFAWVSGLVSEIVTVLEKFLPNWIKPPLEQLESLVTHLVQKELAKI